MQKNKDSLKTQKVMDNARISATRYRNVVESRKTVLRPLQNIPETSQTLLDKYSRRASTLQKYNKSVELTSKKSLSPYQSLQKELKKTIQLAQIFHKGIKQYLNLRKMKEKPKTIPKSLKPIQSGNQSPELPPQIIVHSEDFERLKCKTSRRNRVIVQFIYKSSTNYEYDEGQKQLFIRPLQNQELISYINRIKTNIFRT